MIGLIRWVNPDRGQTLAAQRGRLLAVPNGRSGAWEVVALEGGCQYHPGRTLAAADLRAAAEGCGPDPAGWEWRVSGPWGVDCLKAPPGREELAAIAAEVLALDGAAPETCLDRFEVWASDRKSGRPLALLATALNYLHAEAIGFWPGPTGRLANRYDHSGDLWRFADGQDPGPDAEGFQRRVNERIRSDSRSGLYPFQRRIFERLPDGSAVEHDRGRSRPVPRDELPRGHLAEPLESERVALRLALGLVG